MSNPTTPFSWQMPTATDLVTDLPADFAVFGQAVATSMADLLGGTTGQVLSKTSATDMDFTWINNDQGDITGVTAGTGITVTSPTGPVPTVSIDTATTVDKTTAQTLTNKTLTSPVLTTPSISNINAKGDILVGTADNTLGIITAGNNGESIYADSTAATGLAYIATPSASNPVLNSSYQIWQRGTSGAMGATGSTYLADRWAMYSATVGTVSRQVTGDTTNLPNIQYCARVQRTAATATNGLQIIGQSLESVNSIPFAGKAVTLSFYARKGADFSGASNILTGYLRSGTGTDQNAMNAGFTGSAFVATSSATLTATWQRFTASGTVGTTATQLETEFRYTTTGTAGAADYFEVTGVQVDIGSVALPFRTYASTIATELAACQRYLPAITGRAFGYAYATTTSYLNCKFTVPARVAPTGITLLTAAASMSLLGPTLASGAPSAVSFNDGSVYSADVIATTTVGSPTIAAGQGVALETGNGILFTGCEL